jgi:hypothetical protein
MTSLKVKVKLGGEYSVPTSLEPEEGKKKKKEKKEKKSKKDKKDTKKKSER